LSFFTDQAVAFNLDTLRLIDGEAGDCGNFAFLARGIARSLTSGRTFILQKDNTKDVLRTNDDATMFSEAILVSPPQHFALYGGNSLKVVSFEGNSIVWSRPPNTSLQAVAMDDTRVAFYNEHNDDVEIVDWSKNLTGSIPLRGQWKFLSSVPASFSPDGGSLVDFH
jgi:hypothetical protein